VKLIAAPGERNAIFSGGEESMLRLTPAECPFCKGITYELVESKNSEINFSFIRCLQCRTILGVVDTRMPFVRCLEGLCTYVEGVRNDLPLQ